MKVRSLQNVLVTREDVARLRRETLEAFSMHEAASILGINRYTPGKLRMQSDLVRADGRMTLGELRELRHRFVTLREIAAAFPAIGRHVDIVDHLKNAGVSAVMDGNWITTVFEREAVVAVLGAMPEEALSEELLRLRQRSR